MFNKILATILIIATTNAFCGLPPTSLTGQSSATNTTTFNFKTPYSQSTQINGINSLIETGSENMLINPGFEASALGSAWVNANGVASATSTAGEFSSGLQAAKIALTAQALSFSQSVTTTSGMQTQFTIGMLYKVPSAITDFQICPLIAGVETNCVPSTSLIADNFYHPIEIPVVITPGSTVGIKAKTTATYTQNVFIDAAYVKQGIGYQNLNGDTVYSAQISSSGVISNLNKSGWLSGNCAVSGTSLYDCPLGISLTSKMNCVATPLNGAFAANYLANYDTTTSTTTNLRFTGQNSNSGAATAIPFTINCQKSGNDYLASSSAVYAQASANYGYTNGGSITLTATTSNPTRGGFVFEAVLYSKMGQNISAVYQYEQSTAGIGGTGDYLFGLPNGLSFDSTLVNFYTADIGGTGAVAAMQRSYIGEGTIGITAGARGNCQLYAYSTTKFRALCETVFTTRSFVGSTQYSFGSANLGLSFSVFAPISGWSATSAIVGSFAGVPAVPGYQGNVDTFSISFGATSTTSCSSANGVICPYSDGVGTQASVTHGASTGLYNLVTTKTYTKLKCTGAAYTASGEAWLRGTSGGPINCASCATAPFTVVLYNTASTPDGFGTINCTGQY